MAFFRGLTTVSRLRSRMGQDATTLDGVRWLQIQSASNLDLRSQLQEMIPEQQIHEDLSRVKHFDAEGAFEYGIIDRIVRPSRIKKEGTTGQKKDL